MKWLLVAILLVLISMAIPGAWIIAGPLFVIVIIGGIISGITDLLNPRGSSRQSVAIRVYQATKDELFEALPRVIANLGHRLQNANKDAGLVVFKTGSTITTPSGYEGSVVIIPEPEPEGCEVRITMSYKGQLWDWDEGQKIALAIFKELEKEFTMLILTKGEEESEDNFMAGEFRFWRNIFQSDPARNKKEWLRR